MLALRLDLERTILVGPNVYDPPSENTVLESMHALWAAIFWDCSSSIKEVRDVMVRVGFLSTDGEQLLDDDKSAGGDSVMSQG